MNYSGSMSSSVEGSLMAAIAAGNDVAARVHFADQPTLDDPFVGAVAGDDGLRDYVAGFAARFRADAVEVQLRGVHRGENISATEFDFVRHRREGRVVFPGVIVADLVEGLAAAVRIYYRRVHIDDTVEYRRWPILKEERAGNHMHPTLERYVEVLKERDTELLLSLFEDDASFGMCRGKDEIRPVFERMFARRINGVQIEHPTAFVDGNTTILEFNSIREDGPEGHPGAAFYEVGESGLIVSARPLDE